MSEYPRYTAVWADTKSAGCTYLMFHYKKSAGAVVEGPRRCSIRFESKEEALQMPNIERAWAEMRSNKRGPYKKRASSAQATPRATRSRTAAKISELETPEQPNNDHLPARAQQLMWSCDEGRRPCWSSLGGMGSGWMAVTCLTHKDVAGGA